MGHTGDLEAVIRACTVVDKCLGELLEVVEGLGGRWLVASDHGNSDDMVQVGSIYFEPLKSGGDCRLKVSSHHLRIHCGRWLVASDHRHSDDMVQVGCIHSGAFHACSFLNNNAAAAWWPPTTTNPTTWFRCALL